MKSRSNLVVDGDRNTQFYHLYTLKRRAANKILGLCKFDGSWTFDYKIIERMIMSHFQKLFSSSHDCSFSDSFKFFNNDHIDNSSIEAFPVIPSPQEIILALKDMAPHKSLGLDGLRPAFFQNHWNIVGPKTVKEIQKIFRSTSMDSQWNSSTDLVLIPKVPNPENVTQFRPIGLCNSLYQLITKIIVLTMYSSYKTWFINFITRNTKWEG